MRGNILKMLNRLEGYKVAIENIHWSAVNMSEHKQCDELAGIVGGYEDKIAEIAQGIYGDVKRGELKPERVEVFDSKDLVKTIYSDAVKFGKTLTKDIEAGLRSENDTFIGEMEKQYYLFGKCLKEDAVRLDNIVQGVLNEEIRKGFNRYR